MKHYEAEKSINGAQFTTFAIVPATANNGNSAGYVIPDTRPADGYNYYRIKSMDINGRTGLSNIVKVLMGISKQDITVNTNRITDGIARLQFNNQPAGDYMIRLINKLGQVIVSKQINHADGSSTEIVKWDYNLAPGVYHPGSNQTGRRGERY